MKPHSTITINGRTYGPGEDVGEMSSMFIYFFFLIHMGAFGLSGFIMAYAGVPLEMVYMHGGIAICVYLVFYLAIFGLDEVKWMFINAGLGLFGILSQINWILSLFGKHVSDYSPYVHVIPFLYYVLYTFLLRHAVLDLTGSRDDEVRKKSVEYAYIVLSVAVSVGLYYLERR